MRYMIVSVTDRKNTAVALETYLQSAMRGQVDPRYMTYRDTRYSAELVRQADLFVFELFAMDRRGPYTEGIFAAEKWLSLGMRALVLSGSACAREINSPLYWDLAARDELRDRILTVIEAPVPRPSDLAPARTFFSKYYRHPEDPHFS